MRKRILFRTVFLAAAVICMLLIAACTGKPSKEESRQPSSQTDTEKESEQTDSSSETESEPSEPSSEVTESETEPSESETEPSEPSSEPAENPVAKINGGADKAGIYSVVVKMTDAAADKGSVELVYYGEKGSPQENSIVNTFLIEYYRDDAGTFEIHTFSNGEVYQNQHGKDEVKVTNTFAATLRAGSVIISYTPDGGEKQKIFEADADYFR